MVSFLYVFPSKPFMHLSYLHTCYVSRPSYSSWFDHPNNIWWAVPIMTLFTMLSPVTSFLLDSHVHSPFLTSYQRFYQSPRLFWTVRNMLSLYGEKLWACRPTPKLEEHPSLALSCCWGRSTPWWQRPTYQDSGVWFCTSFCHSKRETFGCVVILKF